jgi:hypothetical protein
VAFALVALLVVLMGGGIRFGSKVWETSRLRAETINEIHTIRHFVRERVLAARPVKRADQDRSKRLIAFQGHGRGFGFVTLMPSYVARGGLYHVEFSTSERDGAKIMVMKYWPFGGDPGGPGAGQRNLIGGIEEMKISYFGAPDDKAEARWLDDWPEATTLPRLISIKLSFPDEDPRAWPELMVALPLSLVTSNGRRNN